MAGSVQRTVNNSATSLDANVTSGTARSVILRNRGTIAIFVGGADVTTSNGYQVDPGESLSIDVSGWGGANVAVYAITVSSTATVHVLQV